MEPNVKSCSICQCSCIEPDSQLKLTCQHSFCFGCFSYIIYQRMSTVGFQSNFFEGNQNEFECPICQKQAKMTINLNEMINAFKKSIFSSEKSEIQHCEACLENPATLCCIGCQNQNYCEGCLNLIHKANKRFADHKIVTLEEKRSLIENEKMACNCPTKRPMEFYCQKCKKSMCIYCVKAENHETHPLISLEDIFDNAKAIDQKETSSFLKQCCKEMQEFQKKTLNSFELVITKSIDEINGTFEAIKNKLNKLQGSMLFSLNNQLLTAKNNFKLIELSLATMKEEMEHEKILNLHPNKLPMLLEFFKENQCCYLNVPNEDVYKYSLIKNWKLEEIEKILSNNELLLLKEQSILLRNEENWEIKIKKQNDNNMVFNFDQINFSCDVQKIYFQKILF